MRVKRNDGFEERSDNHDKKAGTNSVGVARYCEEYRFASAIRPRNQHPRIGRRLVYIILCEIIVKSHSLSRKMVCCDLQTEFHFIK